MGFTLEAEERSYRLSVASALFLGNVGAVLAAALALSLAFAPLGHALSLDEAQSPIEAGVPGDGPAQSDPEGPAPGDAGNGGEKDDAVQDSGDSDDLPSDDVDTAPAPEEGTEQLLPPEAPPAESVANQRAVQGVGYIDASGAFRQTPVGIDVSVLTEAYLTDHGNELASGWYVVSQNVTTSSIAMKGDVHLILADGQTLRSGALVVQEPSALTVYGQTTDSAKAGTLVATSSSSGAGIGGRGSDVCGTVVINGGNVRAQGATFSPGIGGGEGSRGGRFVINGGNVEARGGLIAAGIGIGAAASGRLSISINGGVVNAVGGVEGAGIGTVSFQNGDAEIDIAITGGTVIAESSFKAIGGSNGQEPSLAVDGGLVIGVAPGGIGGAFGCVPLDARGGAMLSVARKADCAIAGNAATLASSSEAMIGGFGPSLGIPAGTVVSDSPTVTLPANQQMGFTSSKGEYVTAASPGTPAAISFGKGDAMFLPAGFFATIGGDGPVQSPAQGM